MENNKEQSEINIKVMFRQCGIGYDKKGNPIYNQQQLIEWFEASCNKKDFTTYDIL